MNRILKNDKVINLILYSIAFILFFIALKPVKPYFGDDFVYMGILSNKSYFQWLVELYSVWSGRIVLTSFLILFLNIPIIIWRVVNSFFLTLLVVSILKVTKLNKYYIFSIMFLVLKLPINILNSSSFWITGSINYLWPISASLYLIYILREFYENKEINLFQYILSLFFAFIASNNEQSGLVLITFYTILIILKFLESRKLEKKLSILYVFLILGYAILMLAPGNISRLNIEVLGIMPGFRMLSVYDKLMYGINYSFQILFYNLKYYLLFMALLINIISLKLGKKNLIFSLIPTSIIGMKIFFDLFINLNPYCRSCNDLHYILFNYKYFSVNNFTEWIHLIPLIIALMYVLAVLINIILISKSIKILIFTSLTFIASISSSIVLGFSPTIEASGNRIYFLMVNLIILLIALLLENIEVKENKIFYIGVNSISIILVVQIVLSFSNIVEFIVLY